jgi:DNA-binding protein HU-beta
MTQGQVIEGLAVRLECSKNDARTIFAEIAQMAYENAKEGFILPGIGKLVILDRKARMGRNPATGESIKIPAKKVVKFRVAKVCKESILPKAKAVKVVTKKKAKK